MKLDDLKEATYYKQPKSAPQLKIEMVVRDDNGTEIILTDTIKTGLNLKNERDFALVRELKDWARRGAPQHELPDWINDEGMLGEAQQEMLWNATQSTTVTPVFDE